ncbi:MAG: protein nirF [Nitrospirota bacterium]|nr:protein nirF [Nitrospirota bacterium]
MNKFVSRLAASTLLLIFVAFLAGCAVSNRTVQDTPKKRWGTAALMVVVERESGSVLVFDSTKHEFLGRITGLGNLKHATMVFSRDGSYAYVFQRDGWMSKLDLLSLELVKRVKAGDDSIGGAITQDGKYIAVGNYKPGGITIVDAETMEIVKVIPAIRDLGDGKTMESRVVGVADAPDNLLLFALMDADGIWIVDAGKPDFPVIKKHWDIGAEGDTGAMPYDAFLGSDGRYYVVGLLNANYMAMIDTWNLEAGVQKILTEQGAEPGKVPLWKVPHLEGWTVMGGLAVVPALKENRVIVYDAKSWELVKYIDTLGTALFNVGSPDGKKVWVDIVGPGGDSIQVIDIKTLSVVKTIKVGEGAIHPQFTPKGEAVYVSVMDEGKVVVYNSATYEKIKEFPAQRPSGIFCTSRAHQFGL